MFHPMIDPVSGVLDVTRGFGKWKRNVNHMWHVLSYVRRAFYKIDTTLPANNQAAAL